MTTTLLSLEDRNMTDSTPTPTTRSWIAEMLAAGTTDDWCSNALIFPDAHSAANYAKDLFSRWMGCSDWRVVEVDPTHPKYGPPNKPSTATAEQLDCTYTDKDGFPA